MQAGQVGAWRQGWLTDDERAFAQAIRGLVYCNPFLAERIERERVALGHAFVAGDRVWNALGDHALLITPGGQRPMAWNGEGEASTKERRRARSSTG